MRRGLLGLVLSVALSASAFADSYPSRPIRLIIPFQGMEQENTPGGGSRAVKLTVVGIVRMGMYEYDSKFAYATLPFVQKLMDQPMSLIF